MPTTKRERQRAGRQARQAALQKAAKRRALRRQIIIGVVVVLIGLGVVYLLSRGGGKKKPAGTATKASTAHTTAASPAGCPSPTGSSPRRTTFPSAQPPMCINPAKAYSAMVKTDVGSFTIKLDAKASPKTVNAFVYLARYHFYDGLPFHRVIPGFVVQGGDPNPPANATTAPSGPQGPGFVVQGEVPHAGAYHLGTVAMAKTGSQPAGAVESQFFVVTGSQGTSLPPLYSVLGQVTSGMSVVNTISAAGSPSGTPRVLHKIVSVTIRTP
ncbi:MAG: peptidylprolyl isomerase [Actinomycetota bacterium]|nr:peptidylprolyl isomerase [Actinomycetota bacterium]